MKSPEYLPSIVLICHENDPLDTEALASWLASTMNLAGLIVIRDESSRMWRVARREIRRVGWLGFLDVVAFRLYQRLRLARRDNAWKERQLARIRARYPANLTLVPTLVVRNPNDESARAFVEKLQPDLALARCKFILKPSVFRLPKRGTFVLHPGICPEYRNAHGCFWALVRRDMDRVGMTLLRVDEGVDTGPIYLQATCGIDEVRESHTVIQHRVVLENLDMIGPTLLALGRGQELTPVPIEGRRSRTWGQPRLSSYLRWKWMARRSDYDANRVPSLS
jgi:folate-dependent phosphoribosylglycinamide formyltransferase PurN